VWGGAHREGDSGGDVSMYLDGDTPGGREEASDDVLTMSGKASG
jgi:hypothetical protein